MENDFYGCNLLFLVWRALNLDRPITIQNGRCISMTWLSSIILTIVNESIDTTSGKSIAGGNLCLLIIVRRSLQSVRDIYVISNTALLLILMFSNQPTFPVWTIDHLNPSSLLFSAWMVREVGTGALPLIHPNRIFLLQTFCILQVIHFYRIHHSVIVSMPTLLHHPLNFNS